jgi:predicted  nucleic acid-binding Zn-ribbon protein
MGINRCNTKSFIEKAKLIHGDKYDYTGIILLNSKSKINIICPIHGNFNQNANNHIKSRNANGCPKCGRLISDTKRHSTTEKFIKRAQKVHNNKYDYSNTKYTSIESKVNINCIEHGEFFQFPNDHIYHKHGCPKCANKLSSLRISHTIEQFIQKAKNIHNNQYDYSKSIYIGSHSKIEVVCIKHGSFWPTPTNHIDKQSGCPKCKSSKGEKFIAEYLTENHIIFETQKRFDNCRNKIALPFDFYLPEYNLLIEFHGIQHFKDISHFWKYCDLKERQRLDLIKKNYALNNGFDFLEITYKDNINNKLIEYFNEKTKTIIN